MPDSDEPRIRELLAGAQLERIGDAEAQRALEQWLAAAAAASARPAPQPQPMDEELQAVIERRAKACEAVDPTIVEAIEFRYEVAPESLIKFEVLLELQVRDGMPMFDYAMVDQLSTIAEPREVEIPEQRIDELRETSPQALLRDLHRVVNEFPFSFEIIDVASEQRLDIVAAVDEAMATSWALPPLGASPFEQERRQLQQDRVCIYRRPWIEIRMPNRTVTE